MFCFAVCAPPRPAAAAALQPSGALRGSAADSHDGRAATQRRRADRGRLSARAGARPAPPPRRAFAVVHFSAAVRSPRARPRWLRCVCEAEGREEAAAAAAALPADAEAPSGTLEVEIKSLVPSGSDPQLRAGDGGSSSGGSGGTGRRGGGGGGGGGGRDEGAGESDDSSFRLSLSGFWSWYKLMLSRYPLRTNAVQSAVIGALGDSLAQRIEERDDRRRIAKLFAWGLFLGGPIGYFFYRWLDGAFPTSAGLGNVARKVALNAVLLTPVINFLFLSFVRAADLAMDGEPRRIPQEVRRKLEAEWVRAYVHSFKIWPLAHFCNFALVPAEYRMLGAASSPPPLSFPPVPPALPPFSTPSPSSLLPPPFLRYRILGPAPRLPAPSQNPFR
eukprot:tig00020675_g12619.t1